ncbi:hypothetical protein CLOHYLEM_06809 [[Clostridium] hylemonae DSM 15053]|uniref:Uncharacterized protein n=1 Tax=[Clostridium] hylemonae DSM 15053 TaxID=553973 RepID=C0C3Z6_9FIRM|nr:hypothetical protein CLOHYLEM_06809 [[Clostridium] hylemonae DSM 15053]
MQFKLYKIVGNVTSSLGKRTNRTDKRNKRICLLKNKTLVYSIKVGLADWRTIYG